MIGRVVGNYRIIEKLGEGGMGTVYRAVDQMVERNVAIKVLKPEIARDPDTVERFRSEAVALARLNHPSIATLFSFFKEGDELFMAMEFVPGETLEHLIRLHGSMKWQSAVEVLLYVLEGIQHAHNMGILHRDLKPANIMLTPDGRVKITDFGIAKVINTAKLTREARLVGTLEYLAPERALGQPADARSDLYSLGVVFYEMLTGRLPFQADTDFAIIRAQLDQKPPAPKEIGVALPAEIEAVLMKSLAKDPADRYPDATTFAAQFRNAVRTTGMPLPGRAKQTRLANDKLPQQPPSQSAPVKGIKLGVIAAAATALVAAAGLTGWGVWNAVFPEKPKVAVTQQVTESVSAQPAQPAQMEPLGPAVILSPRPSEPGPVVVVQPSQPPPQASGRPAPPLQARSARLPDVNMADVLAALELTDGPVAASAGGPRPIHYAAVLKAVQIGGAAGAPVIEHSVQQRGVNFQLNDARANELRSAGAPATLVQAIGANSRAAVAVAQPPPPVQAPPAAQPVPAARRAVRGLRDVRTLFVRPMPGNFDETLRVEIISELGDRFRLVTSAGAADAVLEILMDDEGGGPRVVGQAGRILGISGKKKVTVTMVEQQQHRVLWSAEAGDRKSYFGSFGDGGKRMASRIAKKLKHDAN
jgi:serine/threonine protein kinase